VGPAGKAGRIAVYWPQQDMRNGKAEIEEK